VCTLQFLPRSQGSSRQLIAQSLQIRVYGIGKFWDAMNIPPLSPPNNVSTQDGADDLVSWIYNGRIQFLWKFQKLTTYLASNMRERILSICSRFIEKSLAGCGNWFSIFLTSILFFLLLFLWSKP
jgi:hypothetical protein